MQAYTSRIMKKTFVFTLLMFSTLFCKAATQIYIPSTSTFHNYVINIGSGTIRNFQGNSTTATFVNSSSATFGNVSIGTTTFSLFSSLWSILRIGQGGILLSKNITPSETSLTNNYYFNGANDNRITANPVSVYTQDSNGSHVFYSDLTGPANTAFTLTQRFKISPSGIANFSNTAVGIGTTTPQSILEISSNTQAIESITTTQSGGNSSLDFRAITSIGTAQRWQLGVGVSSTNGTFQLLDATLGRTNLGISTTTGGVELRGTNTNDNTNDANYGFTASSVSSTAVNFAASNTYQRYLALSLSSGDWLVSGQLEFKRNTATWTEIDILVSLYDGVGTTDAVYGDNNMDFAGSTALSTIDDFPLIIPPTRFSVATSTTVYLKGFCTYSANTPQLRAGSLKKVRIR